MFASTALVMMVIEYYRQKEITAQPTKLAVISFLQTD